MAWGFVPANWAVGRWTTVKQQTEEAEKRSEMVGHCLKTAYVR